MSTEITETQKQELFNFLLETAKQSKDLIQSEAPQVFSEIITYGSIRYDIELFFALVGIAVSIVCGFVGYKFWNKGSEEFVPLWAISGILGLISFVALYESIFGLGTVLWAPRVYVIQFLSGS